MNKGDMARIMMIEISKHFLDNENMSNDEFWKCIRRGRDRIKQEDGE